MSGATTDLDFVQVVLDSMADPIFVKDLEHRWIVFNQAFCQLLGRSRADLLGKSDPDLFPPDQVEVFWALDDQLFESGEANENEEFLTDEAGVVHTLWTRKYPVRVDGKIVGLVGIISDITALRKRLDSIRELEETTAKQKAALEAQNKLIDTIKVPVIEVWDRILLVPLIGEVSERRATQVLDRLLTAIASKQAKLVFIDVSEVPTVTESSAAILLRTVAAARLLGARAAIVGVSPTFAQMLIERGLDLKGIETHATLREGLRQVLTDK